MMGDLEREAILQEVEELRAELIGMFNANIDALIQRLTDDCEGGGTAYEYEYPLGVASSLLKGTKPAAVIFGGEKVATTTWKRVYTEILCRCDADPKTHDALMYLRNKMSGRKRVVLSNTPDGMNKPVMLAEGLYAEAYFDTEWLLRTLMQILDAAHYDYSGITIAVSKKKR